VTRAEAHDALPQEWRPWVTTIEGVPGVEAERRFTTLSTKYSATLACSAHRHRGAVSGMTPNRKEWYGERGIPQDSSGDARPDQRNENIRRPVSR
jgi:hypothetical protein